MCCHSLCTCDFNADLQLVADTPRWKEVSYVFMLLMRALMKTTGAGHYIPGLLSHTPCPGARASPKATSVSLPREHEHDEPRAACICALWAAHIFGRNGAVVSCLCVGLGGFTLGSSAMWNGPYLPVTRSPASESICEPIP